MRIFNGIIPKSWMFGALILALGLPPLCFGESAPKNSVWFVTKNETGRSLYSFSLDYGTGKFNFEWFDRGLIHGDYVKVLGKQPLTVKFKDKAGKIHQYALERPLTADMDGGIFTVHLKPEGKAEFEFSAAPQHEDLGSIIRAASATSEGRVKLLISLTVIIGGPLLAFIIIRGLIRLPARLKKIFTFPVLNELKARMSLSRTKCPVLRYSSDSARTPWWQGAIDGRMLGVDSDRIWIGGVDGATLFYLERLAPGASPSSGRKRLESYYGNAANAVTERFCGDNLSGSSDFPLLRHEALMGGLPNLSPAVTDIIICSAAVQATIDWRNAQIDAVLADVKILSAIVSAIEESRPPLIAAILKGDAAQALALIKKGADVNAVTIDHIDALTAAAGAGNLELVKKLVEHGAKLTGKYRLPLQAAAGAGHREIVVFLLDRGLPVDASGYQKWTALMSAAEAGKEPIVELLLSRGADVSREDREGSTALNLAETGEHAGIIALLKKSGAA